MMADVLRALALVLVLEGAVLFLMPEGMKETWKRMIASHERVLRTIGLGLMVTGLLALQIISWNA
ncbi:MAG: DUF2065 domain-containing protein [Gammaproteobacteria bacterium]|jgi:uncharacterized protein YjeT (DUF2065 family)|nr:DUF2065 domain-containing protein [Gammaproteobacteria bacterium]